MSWLLKIASKEEFLFSKYRKKARALWSQHFESDRSNDWADALLKNPVDSLQERLDISADRQLKAQISSAIQWNPKYADWAIGRLIAERWPKYIGESGMFHPIAWTAPAMRELNDYLTVGRGQIQSFHTTFEEAHEASSKWHKEMGEKVYQYKTDDVVTELSDGYKLVKVPKEDAKAEGHHMGHCVGSYCEDIAAGKSIIFSIRDANNNPHVTLEVQPAKFSDPQKGDYWVITQIQGKENKPQPKYGNQVGQAIQSLMGTYPVTISGEGLSDFYGFQTNFDRRMEVLSRISEEEAEHDEVFDLHHFARSGGIPQDPLYDWMEENLDQLMSDYSIDDSDFFPYLMDSNFSREDLLERLDMIRDDYVTTDEDEAEEDEDLITEGDWNSFYNSVSRGAASAFSIPDPIEAFVYDWIEEQKQSDSEAVKEYFWDNYGDVLKSGYINELSSRIEFDDLEDEYDQWERYYQKKQEEQLQQHATQLVTDAIEQYGIQLPDIQGPGVTGSMEPVVTIPRIVWKMSPKKHWLTMQKVSREGVERAIELLLEENQNRVDKEQIKLKDFERWLADYSTPVPELQQLPDYDQWYFYNTYGHMAPDRKWVEVMRQQIAQRISRRAPQQPSTTNLTPGQDLSHIAPQVVEHEEVAGRHQETHPQF